MDLEKADKKVWAVETQWHYKALTSCGFVPVTKEDVGLVRRYEYKHPDGRKMVCNTGYSADYWSCSDGKQGYWKDLEKYLGVKLK